MRRTETRCVSVANASRTSINEHSRSPHARLKTRYEDEVRDQLMERFGLKSVMAVPRVTKVTLNMGVGEGRRELPKAARRRPWTTSPPSPGSAPNCAHAARPEVDRRVQAAGGHAHRLQGGRSGATRMYEFFDRLDDASRSPASGTSGASIRDSFDGRGNFADGPAPSRSIFPEINYDDVTDVRGLNIVDTAHRLQTTSRRASSCAPWECPSQARKEEQGTDGKGTLRVKQARPAKYKTRAYHRCGRCGRSRAYYRKFGVCRICLRELAHQGVIPGMTKSSW